MRKTTLELEDLPIILKSDLEFMEFINMHNIWSMNHYHFII